MGLLYLSLFFMLAVASHFLSRGISFRTKLT